MVTAIICLVIGAVIGVLSAALCRSAKEGCSLSIDDCERCKADMCASCDVSKKLEASRADTKALYQELLSERRSKGQVKGAYCRTLYELWSAENKVSKQG